MPNYSIEGKILTTISAYKFRDLMERGKFVKVPQHKALLAILYYFGIRISEALKLTKQSFTIEESSMFLDVGERLKHSKKTQELSVRLDRPYVKEILESLELIKRKSDRIFPYSRVTGWRIVRRAIKRYPHFLRLNRITHLFSPSHERPEGYSIGEVKNFTGLTLQSLEYYIGLAKLKRIGDELV